MGITQKLVKNANSWSLPHTYWIRNSGVRSSKLSFNKPSRWCWYKYKNRCSRVLPECVSLWEYFNIYVFSDFPEVSITLPAYIIKMLNNRKSEKEEKVNGVEVKGENNVIKKRKTQEKKAFLLLSPTLLLPPHQWSVMYLQAWFVCRSFCNFFLFHLILHSSISHDAPGFRIIIFLNRDINVT